MHIDCTDPRIGLWRNVLGVELVPRLEWEIARAGGRNNEPPQMEAVICFILMETCKSTKTHISVHKPTEMQMWKCGHACLRYTHTHTWSVFLSSKMHRYAHKRRHLICRSCSLWKDVKIGKLSLYFLSVPFLVPQAVEEATKHCVKVEWGRARQRSSVQLSQFGCRSPLSVFEVFVDP